MRWGEGPPGEMSIWSWSPLFFGRPLNLGTYTSCKSPSSRDLAPAMKLFCFTVHPWNPRVRCRSDFMDAYLVSATCFARLTCWSVTQLMCLNSRMTSSPPFFSVDFLIANPSGRLFLSLPIAIVSSVVPASRFLLSASVRG
jgi:hypothetical protein